MAAGTAAQEAVVLREGRSRVGVEESELVACLLGLEKRIYRLFLSALGDAEEARSSTQECFLRALERREQFRGEGALEGWVMRIAVHLLRDAQRSRRLRFWRRAVRLEEAPDPEVGPTWGSSGLADARPGPDAELEARQALVRLQRSLRKLSSQQLAVFHLRFVEGLELAAIGAQLGLATGTVKSHLARAVERLRREVRS